MSLTNTPRIVTNGLTLLLDAGNLKSFPGEPTSNIINSVTNTYPTVGNGWGTYNTNQYGSGTFFSIGTVSGVSNNEVTMTSPHGLRTYDVMRPQTTGGGLTANTDYYIKKTGSTTFTVHQYNGSENGTLGFEVLRPIRSDIRISINATNFPTMWWGAPHLPNSGLIKTIIPNAFNGHECIRLNWYRPDGVTDGMAYGVTPNVTGGLTYTFSYYYRAGDANAIGKTVGWSVYYTGNATYDDLGGTAAITSEWKRHVVTVEANASGAILMYWFPSSGPCSVDIAEIQIENKSYATRFTPTARDTTNGWKDISGNNFHGSLFNGPTYSSDGGGSVYFDGNDDYVTASPTVGQSGTFSLWVKSSNYNGKIPFSLDGNSYGSGPNIYFTGGIIAWNTGDGGANAFTNSSYPDSNWHNICITNQYGVNAKLYIDGVLIGTAAHLDCTTTGANKLWLGRFHGDTNYNINGYITMVSIHDYPLTPKEVLQNYTTLKKRFGK